MPGFEVVREEPRDYASLRSGDVIGWNFGVVGGSTLLAASVPTQLRPRVEGLGEVSLGPLPGRVRRWPAWL
ncbi:MAG TPA: hypothetical protein VI008_08095 [Rubrobacter sp.]|jgi:hypothetical protein